MLGWKPRASVADYSASHDHTLLEQVDQELAKKFSGDLWAIRAEPWRH
ncbi:MAG: hypothetical protein ACRD0Y_04395 [Terriglobales bacterium]